MTWVGTFLRQKARENAFNASRGEHPKHVPRAGGNRRANFVTPDISCCFVRERQRKAMIEQGADEVQQWRISQGLDLGAG